MKKKAAARKKTKKKITALKLTNSKHEAGVVIYLSPNESFFWMNRGTHNRTLTGCGALLTQDTYTVRPGHPEPAQARQSTGDHEYTCVPPVIRDNPHIIIS